MKTCPKCEMTFSDFSEKCEFCDVDLEIYYPEKTVSEIEKIYASTQNIKGNKTNSIANVHDLSTKEILGYIVAGALCVTSLVFLFLSGKSCVGCIGGDENAGGGILGGILGAIFFFAAAFFVWAISCTGDIVGHTPPKTTPKPTTLAQDTNEVRCPKCGSTQITAVQRKWTFMAGFATNKVDRFCMNCKHKW